MQKQYWNTIRIADIKSVNGVGGSFGEEIHTYFSVTMKDGTTHYFHYDSRKGYEKKRELHKLFNEHNNIPESYLLENDVFVEVGGARPILFGCRVENNIGSYEYKTLLEIDELTKQGKIRDEGWRHLAYICPIRVIDQKVIGEFTEPFKEQLDAMGIVYQYEGGEQNGL